MSSQTSGEFANFLQSKMLNMLDRRAYSRKQFSDKAQNYLSAAVRSGKPAALHAIFNTSQAETGCASLKDYLQNESDEIEQIIADICDRFEELHLLDDVAYAETIFRQEVHLKHRSVRLAQQKMRLCGIADDVALSIINNIDTSTIASEQLEYISSITQRALQNAGVDSFTELSYEQAGKLKTKLTNKLLRKGYSYEVIREGMKDYTSSQ